MRVPALRLTLLSMATMMRVWLRSMRLLGLLFVAYSMLGSRAIVHDNMVLVDLGLLWVLLRLPTGSLCVVYRSRQG